MCSSGKFSFDSNSPDCDVKDVASHRAGHGHVAHAFTCHNHAGDEVGDGRPRSQYGQAHDLLRDADGFAHLRSQGWGITEVRVEGTTANN